MKLSQSHVRPWCDLRHNTSSGWRPLTYVTKDARSFLRFLPDLKKTPPEVIESPPDVENITDRIESETAIVGSESNYKELNELRDRLIRNRTVGFHWNLNEVIDGGKCRLTLTRRNRNIGDEVCMSSELKISNRLPYEFYSFVGTLDNGGYVSVGFGIARNLDVVKNNACLVIYLRVRWSAFKGNLDLYYARYCKGFLIKQ